MGLKTSSPVCERGGRDVEPLQTWWATELYPSKDDENFEVSKQAAQDEKGVGDAQ